MKQEEIKLFRRFLKENGVYSAFIRNYDPLYVSVGRISLNKEIGNYILYKIFLCKIHVNLPITSAFRWATTPEGEEFWSDVDNKWASFLKEKKLGWYKTLYTNDEK